MGWVRQRMRRHAVFSIRERKFHSKPRAFGAAHESKHVCRFVFGFGHSPALMAVAEFGNALRYSTSPRSRSQSSPRDHPERYLDLYDWISLSPRRSRTWPGPEWKQTHLRQF